MSSGAERVSLKAKLFWSTSTVLTNNTMHFIIKKPSVLVINISTTLQTSSWSASERLVYWSVSRREKSSPDEDDGVVAGIWNATGGVPAFSQREAVCFSWWEERESWLKYHVLGFRSKKNNERLRGTFSIVIDRLVCPFYPPFGGSWAQDEFVFIVLLRQTLIVLLKSKIDKDAILIGIGACFSLAQGMTANDSVRLKWAPE